jgi:WD40 repeat protein
MPAIRCLIKLIFLALFPALALSAGPPAHTPSAAEIAALINRLDHKEWAERKKAATKLEALGKVALEPLRKTTRTATDVDVRLRAAVVARAILESMYGEIRGFPGPWHNVQDVVFLSDGRRLLSGNDNSAMHLWDGKTGKEIRRFGDHRGRVLGVASLPGDKQALTAGQDATVRLWDLENGKELKRLTGHNQWVTSVAASPDGKYALSGSGGIWNGHWQTVSDCTARLWDLNTGKELNRFEGHTKLLHCVCFSPDGQKALTASADNTIRLWDVKTAKELKRYVGHAGPVFRAAFQADGKRFLSASEDKTLRLWDVKTGKELKRLEPDPRAVAAGKLASGITGMALSPNGKMAISMSWSDTTVRLWDVEKAKEIYQFTINATPKCAAFSQDGKIAVTGDQGGRLRLWRTGQ